MAPPSPYTAQAKQAALDLYEQVGVAQAARETGIPAGTIKAWAHRNGNATVAKANTQEALQQITAKRAVKVEQIKDGFADLTLHMQERAIEEEKGTQAQAWTTSAAISADKLLLMSGEATSRHETRSDLDGQIVAAMERQRVRAYGQRSMDHGRIIDPDAIEAEAQSASARK